MSMGLAGALSQWSRVIAFPLRPYVAKLAQHFGELAQQILWKGVKKMLVLDNLSNFQPNSY